ncbi:taste receptor type 2 member 40-like [Hyla sarda]|uniref:taste receptor type 2 member 40-like n=1 Tax=Hyla sarda TaxID=327740 RepID=UPI0024C30AC8|nr:taste receptor type 2 member 40-like [Hyla sarda]
MILVIFNVILVVTGSTGSSVILAVQFLDWLKTDHLSPVDLIIISTGFVNLLLQGSFACNGICFLLFVEIYVQVWIVNPLVAFMNSMAFSSLWCSTTLCFYYYVKIINLNGTIFYKLKAKLPVIVPWLLVFSFVISWSTGLPAYWDIYRHSSFPTDNATNVSTTHLLNFKSRCNCLFKIYIGLSAVAFTIILFTAGGFIKSVYKHMTQMKKNNEGLRPGKLSAHISAARTVTLLLIFHLIFYGMLNVIFTGTQDIGSILFSVSYTVASSFPTANAIVLILGNRKLSNKLRYVLGMKSISSNIEVSVTT